MWCDPTYIVEQGVAAEKILDVAKRRHTELIVQGALPAKRPATHLHIATVHKGCVASEMPGSHSSRVRMTAHRKGREASIHRAVHDGVAALYR